MIRKLLWLFVILVGGALLSEGAARVLYRVVEHRPFDADAVDARRRQFLGEARALDVHDRRSSAGSELALHPYVGFVYDPAFDPDGRRAGHGVPTSEWGFLDDGPPVRSGGPDEVVVGIFGGSMAWWVSNQGASALIEELGRIPEFRDKRIVVVRTALGGAKQPQQFMTLAYLLALGGHFDVVIELDGFNEVALPPQSNLKRGVFPFYPRDWVTMVDDLDDPMVTRLAGEITALTRLRGLWAGWFLHPGLRDSAVAAIVWRAGDGALGRITSGRRLALAGYEGRLGVDQRRFSSHGPKREYADEDAMYADLVAVWARSSIEMARLTRANGGRFYHFLQPNQYLPDSKPIGDEERRIAIRTGSEFGDSVRKAYPRMQGAGDELRRQGVAFEDLTAIFAGIEEPLYVDDCCHVNPKGNALIGRRIGETIARQMATGN